MLLEIISLVCEEDKLLVKDEKLIVFKKDVNIKSILQKLKSPFLDKENFRQWIDEENLNDIYNVNDLKLLSRLEFSFLDNKSTSLIVLAGINLIQDFAIQVNHPRNLVWGLGNHLVLPEDDRLEDSF